MLKDNEIYNYLNLHKYCENKRLELIPSIDNTKIMIMLFCDECCQAMPIDNILLGGEYE